jgi:Putative mono-oxygenase ydhR
MHIQVVNFHLQGLSDADYRTACDGWAPAFASVPGLVSKVWLADEATNTYGGVYTWVDQTPMIAFASSELFKAVVTNPNLVDITSRDFSILDGPGVITQARIATAA